MIVQPIYYTDRQIDVRALADDEMTAVSIPDAAERLDLSIDTVRRRVRRGKPTLQVWFVFVFDQRVDDTGGS